MSSPRVVDLFAGAGGFTAGAELAGLNVVACGNHWPAAIETHSANHPNVAHICANLLELDMKRLPAHDVLVASPACQGHSEGSQPKRRPKHEADRNTALAVIACANAHRPATILVENVVAMKRWGPIVDGRHVADGSMFRWWLDGFRTLGYTVRVHEFDTADFGVPQNRERLVVTARLGCALELVAPNVEHRAFGPLVDWDAGDWLPVDRAKAIRVPYERAKARGLGDRFLVHYSRDNPGREFERPIGCVTTKRQWAAVKGNRSRMLTVAELARAMDFPAGYRLPEAATLATRLLGNAIPPTFAAELCRQAVAA